MVQEKRAVSAADAACMRMETAMARLALAFGRAMLVGEERSWREALAAAHCAQGELRLARTLVVGEPRREELASWTDDVLAATVAVIESELTHFQVQATA